MLRGLVCVVAVLTLFPATTAGAPPVVSATAAPATGPAPLSVALTSSGGLGSYHWTFGDGAEGDGAKVAHVYAAGRWTATVTGLAADGSTITAQVEVTAYGITLGGPKRVGFGARAAFRGAVAPAESGVPVTIVGPAGTAAATRTHGDGTYLVKTPVRRPGSYVARSEQAASSPLFVEAIPRVRARLVGSGARGSSFFVDARLQPESAGGLDVRIVRGNRLVLERSFGAHARVRLGTRRLGTSRISVSARPNEGFTPAARTLLAHVVLPRLELGASGAAVVQLARRLRSLHYAVPFESTFDGRLLDAIYAFQKVQGLPRTGAVDPRFWQTLSAPRAAVPRYRQPADHLEVNKPLQVLYVVRGSHVASILPVSTAGLPGHFTPVGRFAIYRKVVGFDPSPLGTLYDPMYFTGGYAIHGNPSVPPYPASHGCVRVPMWIAPQLYATNPYGETVYVY